MIECGRLGKIILTDYEIGHGRPGRPSSVAKSSDDKEAKRHKSTTYLMFYQSMYLRYGSTSGTFSNKKRISAMRRNPCDQKSFN